MSAEPILLRPPGAGLSRRIAAVLATLIAAVLGLTWLALPSPPEPAARIAAAPALATDHPADPVSTAARPHSVPPLPPTLLRFHPDPAADKVDGASLFDGKGQARISEWGQLLATHPDTRIIVTLYSAPGSDPLRGQRIGAAVIRLLAGSEGNPHRMQLILAEPGEGAGRSFRPGDFQLTIETPPS